MASSVQISLAGLSGPRVLRLSTLTMWLSALARRSEFLKSLSQASSSGAIPFLIQPDADAKLSWAHPETSVSCMAVFSFSLIICLPSEKSCFINLTI